MTALAKASIVFLQIVRDLRQGRIVSLHPYATRRGSRIHYIQFHLQLRPCYVERDGSIRLQSNDATWSVPTPQDGAPPSPVRLMRWSYSAINEWSPNDLYQEIQMALEDCPSAYDHLNALDVDDATRDPFLRVIAQALRGEQQTRIPGIYTLHYADGVLHSDHKDMEVALIHDLPSTYATQDDAILRGAPSPQTDIATASAST